MTGAEIALVAAVAFAASVVGGLSGYGTGLILPPVLLPMLGPAAVVPVIGASALLTNASRWAAFRAAFDRAAALRVIPAALPGTLIGAWGYTRMSGQGVTLLIGVVLILLVPARRLAMRRRWHLSRRGLSVAATGYGLIVGATSGTGVVLLSLLLAAGLEGTAVIATDAGISFVLGLAKVAIFVLAGALGNGLWAAALLIGLAAIPGAFVARRLAVRIGKTTHVAILDAVVIFGGLMLVARGAGLWL